MEFDKSRVYTALNADELKIGSKCIFADTIHDLRLYVQTDCVPKNLVRLFGDDNVDRFVTDEGTFIYAYLTEPPAKAIKEHYGWVKKLFRNLRARYRICHYIIKKVFNKYIESTNTDFTMDLRKD